MNRFTLHIPGDSPLHRMEVGRKYLIVLAIALPGILSGQLLVAVAMAVVAVAGLALTRVGLRYALSLPMALWLVIGLLFGYHLVVGTPLWGATAGLNLLTAFYASRILTLTTPASVLVDALVDGLAWLRVFRIDPERVGLAVAIMLGSIPVLLDSFSQVRQAARARGRERHLFALVAPVVIRAVAHGQAVGAALTARGIGDPAPAREA